VLLANVVLAAVAVFFAFSLVKDLSRSRSLPPPPAPRRAAAPATTEEPTDATAATERLATYNVIVAKHLFNPSRSEGGSAQATPAAPPPPKPVLLGVVVDGPQSRAYLEDPTTKRVFGYRIGDSVAGGRLDKISDDKVVIVRSDGAVEVMLRDPSKPKPVSPQPAAATPPTTPGARAETPPVTGARPPVPPRAVRRLPAETNQEPAPQQ
jgi:hypothetical protein